jgi:hypothetical protein
MKRNTSRMHHHPRKTNYFILTRRVTVTLLPRQIILLLPVIPMAVRPRVRESCVAELTRHLDSSSGVQDYLASYPFL